jgi:hypothetical protein
LNTQHAAIANYVRGYLLKHATAGDTLHGARRATTRYYHTLSVYRNTMLILDGEDADDTTREICLIAALFHDVDTYSVEHCYHGDRGAETATKYLLKAGYAPSLITPIAQAIRDHNYDFDDDKPLHVQAAEVTRDLPLTSRIVLDADLIDKIGVSNILAAILPFGLNDKPAFEAARVLCTWPYERARFWHGLLTTRTGAAIGAQRLAYYEGFLEQVNTEMVLEDLFAPAAAAAP